MSDCGHIWVKVRRLDDYRNESKTRTVMFYLQIIGEKNDQHLMETSLSLIKINKINN